MQSWMEEAPSAPRTQLVDLNWQASGSAKVICRQFSFSWNLKAVQDLVGNKDKKIHSRKTNERTARNLTGRWWGKKNLVGIRGVVWEGTGDLGASDLKETALTDIRLRNLISMLKPKETLHLLNGKISEICSLICWPWLLPPLNTYTTVKAAP